MVPVEARVFHAEDRDGWQTRVRTSLERAGHRVILTAQSLEEALSLIEAGKCKDVNVAILDRSIPSNPEDGPQIAAALREAVPGIKIIALYEQTAEADLLADWADSQFNKYGLADQELVEAVTGL